MNSALVLYSPGQNDEIATPDYAVVPVVKHLLKMRARLEAAEAKIPKWLPIETAPGSQVVLVLCKGCVQPHLAYKSAGDWHSSWDGTEFKALVPVLWQPLPAAPEAKV